MHTTSPAWTQKLTGRRPRPKGSRHRDGFVGTGGARVGKGRRRVGRPSCARRRRREVGHRAGSDMGPVAEHGHAVGELPDLLHAVRDVDHSDTCRRASARSGHKGPAPRPSTARLSARPERGCGAFSLTARAISTICCMPMEREPSGRRGSIAAPMRSSFSRASRRTLRRSRVPRRVRGSAPSDRFSATVMPGTVLSSWWMIAIPWALASRGERMSTSRRPPGSGRCRARHCRRGSSSASTCRRRSRPSARGPSPARNSDGRRSAPAWRRSACSRPRDAGGRRQGAHGSACLSGRGRRTRRLPS